MASFRWPLQLCGPLDTGLWRHFRHSLPLWTRSILVYVPVVVVLQCNRHSFKGTSAQLWKFPVDQAYREILGHDQAMLRQQWEIPRKRAFARGALLKFVASCVPKFNLWKIAFISFVYQRNGAQNRWRPKGDGKTSIKNCRKWLQKCFVTLYDVFWLWMSIEERDGYCHKMSHIVVECRKLSWRLSQMVVRFFCCRLLPAVPFPKNLLRLFFALKISSISEVIFKDPKTSKK